VPEGTTVNFDDASTICPSAWLWSVSPSNGWLFANNTTANSQNTDITFNNPGTYIVDLIAYNTNGQSAIAATDTIIVTSTLGLNEQTNEAIRIYPNPTDQLLNISLESAKIENIEIISMLGVSVKSISSSFNSIDVSKLQTGTYLIILTTEEGSKLTSRFSKN
jgi:PKD repeat protein